MTISQGTQLGRYEIRSKLGAGGMGEVYLAEDVKLNRKVAIKLLPAHSNTSEQANLRLLREARAAANLDHPNICSIYEVGEEEHRNFIVMQYVEGETLDCRMKREPLGLTAALHIAVQVADALAEAHAHGIIHRDIKPQNIIVNPRGQVKVMDFGLAKIVQQAQAVKSEAETEAILSTPGAIIGTVPYMSPEQVRGLTLDGRSDIFSFGIVLYEMLTGRQPFQSESAAATASAILTLDPQPVARFLRDAPVELERIVTKSLRKDPEERYQTTRDLLIDLRTLRDELEFKHRLERSTPPDATSEKANLTDVARATGETAVQTTAQVTAQEEKRKSDESKERSVIARLGRRLFSRTALIVIAALLVLAAAGWLYRRSVNARWAREQIPRIEQLAQAGKFFEAYDLAVAVEKYLPDDATITRLMPTISDNITVATEPAGAQVYLKRFAPDQTGKFPPRELLGTTPINNQRIARGEYILYIEKDGYAKLEQTVSGAIMHAIGITFMPPPIRVERKLVAADKTPDRMVFVPGGDYRLVSWGRITADRVQLDDYFIDKYEVSNQDYKEFITAGGYLKREFWKYPFVKDGKMLSFEDAMKEFKDHTGLPGPRSWSNQNYPEGKADYPVTDITWYEASAYAAFRGKQLPTIFQWEKASRNGQVSPLGNYMPWGIFYPGDPLDYHANFKNEGTMPVTSSEFGMSPFGAYNMAGNVSEWCLNETSRGFVATGGSWGEPSYTYASDGTFPAFYSSPQLGFRCALNPPNASSDQGAKRIEIKEEIPTYTPSSDADFNAWLKYYAYDKTPLDPQVVEVKETAEWRREKITFNGAGNERAIAYLYLPKNFPRPLQVIHFVPGSNVENGLRSLPDTIEDFLEPTIKSGRAVFGVVIKGYIERLRSEGYSDPDPTRAEYRDKIVNWITDLRRGLDYLETRSDLDTSRIGFFAISAGARPGLILAAIDNRYRSVFYLGSGLRKSYATWIPEANPINFAPHIKPPKMMFQGRYDEMFSLATEAEPLFKLLRDPKRLVLYDGSHAPSLELLGTTLNGWLDETLGAVRRE